MVSSFLSQIMDRLRPNPVPPKMMSDDSIAKLTIVIPSRNRSGFLHALVDHLRRSGLHCRIIVADSSDEGQALSFIAEQHVDLKRFDPATPFYEKLSSALAAVETDLVALMPDDDIPLPDAIQQCSQFLFENSDYVAAWGHVLNFGREASDFDIHSVQWSSPSIDDAKPLERVYHLVRRYQAFFWAVFRTDAIRRSVDEARGAGRTMFQEMSTLLTMALQGKIARLPIIQMLRGPEISLSRRSDIGPLFAIIEGADDFFKEYVVYRERLIAFAEREGIALDVSLSQTPSHVLDLVHAVGLARELDGGPLNYSVQRLLGAPYPEIPADRSWPGWHPLKTEDTVLNSIAFPTRRYVCRKALLEAGPVEEIEITPSMLQDMARQLEHYRDPAIRSGAPSR